MCVKHAQLQPTTEHTNVGEDTQQPATCTEVVFNRAHCSTGDERIGCTTFSTSKAPFKVDLNRNDLDCAMRKRQKAINICVEISKGISEAAGGSSIMGEHAINSHNPVRVLTGKEADAMMALCQLDPSSQHVPFIPSTSVSVISEQAPGESHHRKGKQRRHGPVAQHPHRTNTLHIARKFIDTRVVSAKSCLIIAIMDTYGPRLMEHAAQKADFLFKHDRKKELVEAICQRSLEMAMPGKVDLVIEETNKIRDYFENR